MTNNQFVIYVTILVASIRMLAFDLAHCMQVIQYWWVQISSIMVGTGIDLTVTPTGCTPLDAKGGPL